MSTTKAADRPSWASILGVVAFAVLLLTAVYVLHLFIQRDEARKSGKRGITYQLLHAMLIYESHFGRFPSAIERSDDRTAYHSWRTRIVFFIGDIEHRPYRFDEPWNSEHNRSLIGPTPVILQDWDIHRPYWNPGHVPFFVVRGEDTLFPGDQSRSLKDIERPLASVLVLVNLMGPVGLWSEPRDFDVDQPGPPVPVAHVGLADGTVETVYRLVPIEELRQWASIK
jgi:hypothetical protein